MSLLTSGSTKQPNYVPMFLAIGAFSFVVGGAVTYQIVKLTDPSSSSAQVAETIAPVEAEPVVADLTVAEVTRAASPSLAALSTEPAPEPVIAEVVAPKPKKKVLSAEEKAAKAQEAIDILNRNKLRMLKEGVVAGLYTVTTDDENRLSLNSRNAASAVTEAKALIASAAKAGTLTVPEGLGTADGEVDSSTMLFAVVQQSLEDGTEDEQDAARELRRQAFQASIAKTKVVNGSRYYTVEPGDSLAYISLQFYGSPSAYNEIFNANKDKLSSPDRIFIGQKLLIPQV